MAQIGFYHLTRTGVVAALPALLGRTLDTGERAVVRCGDAAALARLDDALWACEEPVWLPHGHAATGQAAWQPIWLTTEDEAANGARFLFLVDGCDSERLDAYARVFDLFDGRDAAAVEAARRRWSGAKAAGHALTYWQQGPAGWKKAG